MAALRGDHEVVLVQPLGGESGRQLVKRCDRHIDQPPVEIGKRRLHLHVPDDEIDARCSAGDLVEQRWQENRKAVGRADREAAAGARRIEGFGGGDDSSHSREDIADRRLQFLCPLGRHHTLRRL